MSSDREGASGSDILPPTSIVEKLDFVESNTMDNQSELNFKDKVLKTDTSFTPSEQGDDRNQISASKDLKEISFSDHVQEDSLDLDDFRGTSMTKVSEASELGTDQVAAPDKRVRCEFIVWLY